MFAEETQLERLSKLGDSLEKLKIIDFEAFHPLLENALRKERKQKEIQNPLPDRACIRIYDRLYARNYASFDWDRTC